MLDIHFSRKGEDDLGEEQTKWLAEEIGDMRPRAFIIVCGSPIIANDRIKGDNLRAKSRRLLFEMINMRKAYCTNFKLIFFSSFNYKWRNAFC